jgi:hypothetical protein
MFFKQLYAELVQARLNKFNISDSSLRDWAVNIAGEIGFGDFQVNDMITRFEQAHHI